MPSATGGAACCRRSCACVAKGKPGSRPGGAATGWEDPGYHSQALPELLPAVEALAGRGKARYPVYLLARLEHLVVDPGQAIGWRVWAWAKLVKVWGSLRWSDLQAIIPGELSLVEGRLVTTLRRTKTSGPNRWVRELPVAISEYAFFVKSGWLQEGFTLLKQHASYKRDYLMPRLKADGELERKPAGYADAMVATAGLLAALGLPLEVQGYWNTANDQCCLRHFRYRTFPRTIRIC